jgi:hypothetical protein
VITEKYCLAEINHTKILAGFIGLFTISSGKRDNIILLNKCILGRNYKKE